MKTCTSYFIFQFSQCFTQDSQKNYECLFSIGYKSGFSVITKTSSNFILLWLRFLCIYFGFWNGIKNFCRLNNTASNISLLNSPKVASPSGTQIYIKCFPVYFFQSSLLQTTCALNYRSMHYLEHELGIYSCIFQDPTNCH